MTEALDFMTDLTKLAVAITGAAVVALQIARQIRQLRATGSDDAPPLG